MKRELLERMMCEENASKLYAKKLMQAKAAAPNTNAKRENKYA